MGFLKMLKNAGGFFVHTAKKASLGNLTQLVVAGIFFCFAKLDAKDSLDSATCAKFEKALTGLLYIYSMLQSYCSIGKLMVSAKQYDILNSIKSIAGIATVGAALEAASGHKAIESIVGVTDKKIPVYTFTGAFAIDAAIDGGVGIYEIAVKQHYAIGAKFLTFSALETVEAYFGVWKGIEEKNPNSALLGGALTMFVQCVMSLVTAPEEKQLTAEEILKQAQDLKTKLEKIMESDKTSITRTHQASDALEAILGGNQSSLPV